MGVIRTLLTRQKKLADPNRPQNTKPDKDGYWLKFYKSPTEMKDMYATGPGSCMSRSSFVMFYSYWPDLYGVALFNGKIKLARRFVFKDKYIGYAYKRNDSALERFGGSTAVDKKFYSLLAQCGFKSNHSGTITTDAPFKVPGYRRNGNYCLPLPYTDFYNLPYVRYYPKTREFLVSSSQMPRSYRPCDCRQWYYLPKDYHEPDETQEETT